VNGCWDLGRRNPTKKNVCMERNSFLFQNAIDELVGRRKNKTDKKGNKIKEEHLEERIT
jgi:hypothetical protein